MLVQGDADQGVLSNLQLEVVAYAVHRFYNFRTESDPPARSGFFLGDGAGALSFLHMQASALAGAVAAAGD